MTTWDMASLAKTLFPTNGVPSPETEASEGEAHLPWGVRVTGMSLTCPLTGNV